MKTVLYIITQAELGGAQVHLSYLVRYFYRQFKIHLAIGDRGYLTQYLSDLDIDIHTIDSLQRSINPIADGTALMQLLKLTQQIKPDLIHLHSSKAGVLGKVVGNISKIPTIYSAHGWAFSDGAAPVQKWISLMMELSTTRLATRVICGAESERQLALSYRIASPDKITTIHYGVENQEVLPRSTEATGAVPRIIMVARFSPQKDQRTLIKALSHLEHLDFEMVFVGAGELLEETQAFANTTNIASRIQFLGSRTDLDSLLSESDIFVNSSHYEGLPLCILHAMRNQLPVVATGVSGVPEAVFDGVNGFLIPPEDEKTMANRLELLINDPQKRMDFGRKGREIFLNEFTLDIMLKRTEEIYNDLLVA